MINENEYKNEGGAPSEPSNSLEAPEEARRGALRTMGRLAAYTAPALLALLASTQSAHAS